MRFVPPRRDWPYSPAALIAVAGATLLVYQWAIARPLWLDEQMLAINLRDRTIADYAGKLVLGQGAPFGWLALQRLVLLAFGPSELALRAVPVLFGIGTIGVAWWAGRHTLGAIATFVLVLLLSFGLWVTHYWLELKPYSADTFFALLLPALVPWAVTDRWRAESSASADIARRVTRPGTEAPDEGEPEARNRWRAETSVSADVARRVTRPGTEAPDEGEPEARNGWRAETSVSADVARRVTVWWSVAAVAHWFAYGATLVTPGCGIVLTAFLWRRLGAARAVAITALPSLLWLASFGLHFVVSIRHTLGNEFLQDYWAFAFPPRHAGVVGVIRWLASRLEPLAIKPGGSGLWRLFWAAVASGFLVGALRRPALALAIASVPLSAMTLAALGLVPLFERLSLWTVPALYGAIALSIETSGSKRSKVPSRGPASSFPSWGPALTGASLALLATILVPLCFDIVRNGLAEVPIRTRTSNHQLDDRRAVRWLLRQRTPRSVVLSTHLGLPAVWWYGRVDIESPAGQPRPVASGGAPRGAEGLPVYEIVHTEGRACPTDSLRALARDYDRALIHLGFRFDDVPKGFDEWLLREFGRFGKLTAMRGFADVSRAVVIDFDAGGAGMQDTVPRTPFRGECLAVRPARRW